MFFLCLEKKEYRIFPFTRVIVFDVQSIVYLWDLQRVCKMTLGILHKDSVNHFTLFV